MPSCPDFFWFLEVSHEVFAQAIAIDVLLVVLMNAPVFLICVGVSIDAVYRRRLVLAVCWIGMTMSVHWVQPQLWFVAVQWLPYGLVFAAWPLLRRRRTIFVAGVACLLIPIWYWSSEALGWHVSHLLVLIGWPWLEKRPRWLLLASVLCFTPASAIVNGVVTFWPWLGAIPMWVLNGWWSACDLLFRNVELSFPMAVLVFATSYGVWRKCSSVGRSWGNK